MPGSNNIFFIPIIAKALENYQSEGTLEAAFDEIAALGKLSRYNEGYNQFQAFVNYAVTPSAENFENDVANLTDAIYRLIYTIAAGDLNGTDRQKNAIVSVFNKYPYWRDEYNRAIKMFDDLKAPDIRVEVELMSGDQVIGIMPVTMRSMDFRSIRPGQYSIRLTTGRLLWQGNLFQEDLIWAYAHPEVNLAMAAETEPGRQKPTKIVYLLGKEIEMKVFAGLECGEIKILIQNG